ncbi:alpha-ketoacid dehydrogenase subunit alpha/beta [Halomarina oriensis]
MDVWDERRPAEAFDRILTPSGDLERPAPIRDEAELLAFYRTIVLTRTLESRLFAMQRRGEVSIVSRTLGEEAVSLGSSAALRPADWLFPTYRQTPASLYWDAPIDRLVAGLMGKEPETIDEHLSISDSPAVNVTPAYIPLGANVTNAVGSAMADRFRDRDVVTMAYIGDGSTSQGDFHDALNFAGVFDAPAVIVCQNNQWAISVPAHRQTAAETFAQKADAYGVPHDRVDGNDVFAVYDATRDAVERARRGDGPTFVECVTYRRGEHNTADEESVYRSDREAAYWADRDPLDRLETYLVDEGVLDDDRIAAIEREAESTVASAVDRARSVPRSDPSTMFDNHLHGTSWRERRQRAELRAELNGENPFLDAGVELGGGAGDSIHADSERPSERPTPTGETEPMNLVTAVNRTLHQELARDDRVRLLGYDVGPIGGVFRATEGLVERFGRERVVDTPLSENGILGTAVGMAMRGERVVAEIQFMGFLYPAFGQFMYALAKTYERTGGNTEVPLTVRVPYGGGIKASEYHSESTESFLVHTPGVRVVCPSTPAEAKGLLAASIRHPDPVVVMEPKRCYRTATEPVPVEEYTRPLDDARLVTEGTDVTLLTYGAMIPHAVTAAERVDASVELVDLRTLAPLDVETVLASVRKTGRCAILHEARRTLGLGAELSALVNEHALEYLEAPIKRATGFDVHFPGNQTEDAYLPGPERVERLIEAVTDARF